MFNDSLEPPGNRYQYVCRNPVSKVHRNAFRNEHLPANLVFYHKYMLFSDIARIVFDKTLYNMQLDVLPGNHAKWPFLYASDVLLSALNTRDTPIHRGPNHYILAEHVN